ncbi:MAG TPA: hypothetical protein VMF69_15535 [Gemmataceae bacterium]|nr:hypothetical protein [Gemmataceae bacterium]
MRRYAWICAVGLGLIAGGWAFGGGPSCCEQEQKSFLQRFSPVGGWHPYGGGLLHWWPHHCFPCRGGPDDYCRKPLPHVCWPPYPPYYIWGPPRCCPPEPRP